MQKPLQEIIHQVRGGSKAAFRHLVEEFQDRAFRLAFRMLGDEEDARDTVQESFIKMWQKIHTYDQGEIFSSWMFRIVSNTAIDRIRAKKRHPSVSIDELHGNIMALVEDEGQVRLENEEAGILIRLFTDDLPEKQRIVFSLRDLEGLSAAEVGSMTGYSEDIIKSNLYHARKAIREKLVNIFSFERRDP